MPTISVLMSVYNGEAFVGQAVESILAQTFADFELIVSDNASTDDTVEIVRSYDDPRIRLHVNRQNIGYQANMNFAIRQCTSPFIKFLHGDDRIFPTCVERMVEVMEQSERVGMVFCRRKIDLEPDAAPEMVNFRKVFEHSYRHFGELQAVNDGRAMLRPWVDAGLTENWIGEPSNVMMRRSALADLGLFNPRMRMLDDFDMWVRTMARFDVGFVDEELSSYRFAADNLTYTQTVAARWFDLLWLLEGLAAEPGVLEEYPQLQRAIAEERRKVVWRLGRTVTKDPGQLTGRLRVMADYLVYRVRCAVGRPARLHPPLLST